MPEVQVRKKFTVLEEIFHEGGPASAMPLRRAAVLAVIRNPFAGSYIKEIAGFMDDLKPLGLEMARAVVAAGPLLAPHERSLDLKLHSVKP